MHLQASDVIDEPIDGTLEAREALMQIDEDRFSLPTSAQADAACQLFMACLGHVSQAISVSVSTHACI
jgi:hypothetical protein